MNKIRVVNNKKLITTINKDIILNDYSKISSINKESLLIYIPTNIDTNLDLIFDGNNTYHHIYFIIEDNSSLNVFENKGSNIDLEYDYHYILKENSRLIVNKFNNVNKVEENIDIKLEGINSLVEYNMSIIGNDNQYYKINIYHLNNDTKSHINNHAVALSNSKIELDINGNVPNGIKNCILNQNNKIITMGNNDSIIRPNLYIDEYEVEAKHGASIGKFNDDMIFYLQSRGLPLDDSYHLLMKGFLLEILKIDENKKKELEDIVDHCGR